MSEEDDLIAAWEAWDERPGNEQLVIHLDAAVKAFTTNTLALRRFMAAQRREGLERRLILDQWRHEHG